MKNIRLDNFIDWTIKFLSQQQEADGSFVSVSYDETAPIKSIKEYKTTFTTSNIINCLTDFKSTPISRKIIEKSLRFLIANKSLNWSWNYWPRKSAESAKMPYPDDLDDTFVALSAINKAKPELIDGSIMAKIIGLLTAREIKLGGPYRTWLVSNRAPEIWQDVDLAVNANIGYFLSLKKVDVPGITALIEKAINNDDFTSKYYPSEYTQIYFIARFYAGPLREKLIKQILSRRNKHKIWENPLYTAMMISALINLGADVKAIEKAVKYILRLKKFNAYPFCLDPSIDKKKYYCGSPELTVAYCLEAMARYRLGYVYNPQKIDLRSVTIKSAVFDRVNARFFHFNPKLKSIFATLLNKIAEWDAGRGDEIILLPYFFNKALKEPVRNKLIIELGAANLFGWLAYKIYDDFLDDEGDGKMLGIANVCLREVSDIYREILGNKYDFFIKVMDEIDDANTWEQFNCRAVVANNIFEYEKLPEYGSFGVLAKKSFGHALGPIAILLKSGYGLKSEEFHTISDFFCFYIIARQLNDDAHDWIEDLERGFLNPASVQVLLDIKANKINIKKDIIRLKSVFWNRSVDKICAAIIDNVLKARKVIADLRILKDNYYLEFLLAPIERSAKEALLGRDDMLKFIKEYKGN